MENKNTEINIEKTPEKKPLAIIKKRNVIIVAFGIFLILVYFLLRMGRGTEVKKEIKEETQEQVITPTTSGFEIIDYSKIQKEEEISEVPTYSNVVEESPKENVQQIQEDRLNEKLEAYYEKLISEEIAARNGVIEFTNFNSSEGKLPNVNISDPNRIDLSKFERQVESNDFNKQPEKKAFLKENANPNYNSSFEEMPISKYEIKAGGIIPGIMLTGINSDLPGTMTASVRENVYDTVTGRHLLIPRGTRVVGKYSSNISFGQSRVLVVWQRLIFPDGKSLNLDNFEGVDMSGYSGLVGKVDNHTLKLFQGVVLSSLLGAAAGIIDDGDGRDNSWRNNAGRGAGEEIISIGEAIATRLLAVQPTITIAPGARFNIIVNSDLILEPYIQ